MDQVLSQSPSERTVDPESVEARAVLRTMVMMMIADDEVAPSEVQTISKIFKQMTGHRLLKTELDEEIEAAKGQGLQLLEYLRTMDPSVTPAGKATLVKASAHVAAADGKFVANEEQMIVSLGHALRMPPSEVVDIVYQAQSNLRAHGGVVEGLGDQEPEEMPIPDNAAPVKVSSLAEEE